MISGTNPALRRGLAVLRLLAGPVPAASVAREPDLPRSTTYHLLAHRHRVRHRAGGVRPHEWDFRAHEWDFRAGPGSRIGGSFVAMWRASGRAAAGEGAP